MPAAACIFSRFGLKYRQQRYLYNKVVSFLQHLKENERKI